MNNKRGILSKMLCDNKEDCQSGQQIIEVRKDFVRVADCSLLTKLRQQHMLNEKQFY